ncbi:MULTISPECIES: hypothetical protein [unclassified Janthinobacterium]|uniref:hypothetical protein n=1 Tax=unclassified Janthinobacterium TaxID=2610881 RepID=UPI00196ABF8A|nr:MULTISPECIES: hypothetical protein [unclassified Janthinobacterium]
MIVQRGRGTPDDGGSDGTSRDMGKNQKIRRTHRRYGGRRARQTAFWQVVRRHTMQIVDEMLWVNLAAAEKWVETWGQRAVVQA